jgi:1-acyl-sn-glycerol-3-phosphate acyltransferase
VVPPLLILAASFAIWSMVVVLGRCIVAPRLAAMATGNPLTGLLWLLLNVLFRLLHGLRIEQQGKVPGGMDAGPLIVVCNHQSPIDPLYVQAGCRFMIRWMMAAEYRTSAIDWFWAAADPIMVSRDGRDTAGFRAALRHLRGGGVVGIFPEGGIRGQRQAIHPFIEGAGLLAARAPASLLLVTVDGTPRTENMFAALFEPCQTTVRFVDLLTFDRASSPADITTTIRARMAEATGWPLVD